MNLSFIIVVLFCVSNVYSSRSFFRGHSVGVDIPPPSQLVSRAETNVSYFQQRIDHFDPSNTEVFPQRYYVNAEYFDSNENVVFLMIGGEGAASDRWLSAGAWIESAKQYGALLFQLEHRFYGVSHPFDTISTENLRYLSSRQALEDTAIFITAMNEEFNLTDAKWVAFGGSYAGSMAAWLRQKFPHLVVGAMSASGPLYAQLDFPEYLDIVAADLASHSQECVDTVKTAFDRLEELIVNPGDENITSLFNLCDDIDLVRTESDIANFLEVITDNFAGVAQYNKNYGRTTSVDDLCDILTNETYGDEVQRLAEVNNLFYSTECLDYKYQNTVDYLKNVTITTSGNMRQWIYQTCTEYGWYQTSSQEVQVFGTSFPIEFFTNLCVDVYGPNYNASYISDQISEINTHYGGVDIDVQNVVFVHGSFDPWHPMGLLETTNEASPVIIIEGAAHCSNMYDISDDDLPQLTEARKEINRLIGVWLKRTVGEENSGANSHLVISLINTMLLVLFGFLLNRL